MIYEFVNNKVISFISYVYIYTGQQLYKPIYIMLAVLQKFCLVLVLNSIT